MSTATLSKAATERLAQEAEAKGDRTFFAQTYGYYGYGRTRAQAFKNLRNQPGARDTTVRDTITLLLPPGVLHDTVSMDALGFYVRWEWAAGLTPADKEVDAIEVQSKTR